MAEARAPSASEQFEDETPRGDDQQGHARNGSTDRSHDQNEQHDGPKADVPGGVCVGPDNGPVRCERIAVAGAAGSAGRIGGSVWTNSGRGGEQVENLAFARCRVAVILA